MRSMLFSPEVGKLIGRGGAKFGDQFAHTRCFLIALRLLKQFFTSFSLEPFPLLQPLSPRFGFFPSSFLLLMFAVPNDTSLRGRSESFNKLWQHFLQLSTFT